MKPMTFNPDMDIAPIPFDQKHLQLAREMKQRGLVWKPHVGCFVWDYDEHIEAESPFPMRVYFILSLPRFITIFGSLEALEDKLVPGLVRIRARAPRLASHQAGLCRSSQQADQQYQGHNGCGSVTPGFHEFAFLRRC